MMTTTRVAAATVLLIGLSRGFTVPSTSLVDWRVSQTKLDAVDFKFAPEVRKTPQTSKRMSAVCNDKAEFEIEVGKALDTLRSDYPDILTRSPDFSIYDPNLTVVDPSGVTLHGLKNYKQAFKLVHSVLKLFYCREKSLLTFRLVYDCTRNNIRVSWNVEAVPKAIFGGERKMLHVDGISVYELNRQDGKVNKHSIEHLIINGTPVAPEQGLWFALQKQCTDEEECGIPVFSTQAPDINVVKFALGLHPRRSLFDVVAPLSASESATDDFPPDFDSEAFEKKNSLRRKYGLQPLTPEQFLRVEAEIQQMVAEENEKYASMQAEAQREPPKERKTKFLVKVFGNIFEDTCENNYDCQRPEVCCDFGFKKMCCSSGAMVGQQALQPALQPVPSTNPPYPQSPRRDGGNYY